MLLVRLLRKANYDVQIPLEVGTAGRTDPEHLIYAVGNNRVLLSKNYRDFRILHDLVLAVQGHHPGIIVIREDNNRKRDMKPGQIVRALNKLLASGQPISDRYIILNQWR